ncbi:MAG: preprotein translocase subunit SecG [Burkholderiales bacterium]
MQTVILIFHVLTAICMIGLILMQQGKGADMGAAFGSGSAGSLFGSSGSANFLSRSTAVLATLFFLTSMGLTWFSFEKAAPQGVMTTIPADVDPARVIPVPSDSADPATPENGSRAGEVPQ